MAKEKALRESTLDAKEVTLSELTWVTEEESLRGSTWEATPETLRSSTWEAPEKTQRELDREAEKKKKQSDRELAKLTSDADKVKKRRERNVRRDELAESQRRLEIERPGGFRKDIWEAKKNVFDPNLMRRGLVRKLESKMRRGEIVESLASCRYMQIESLVIMTNQRLLIAGERSFRGSIEMEFAYKDIHSIESVSASMIIHAGGSKTELYMIGFQGEPMAKRLRERIASVKARPGDVRVTSILSTPDNRDAPADVFDQLTKLAKLHASGVLNDAEFNAKKGEFLKRL